MPLNEIDRRKRKVPVSCPQCGEERQVSYQHSSRAKTSLCFRCGIKKRHVPIGTAENCWNWKGGRVEHEGYFLVYVPKNDFFYSMGRKSYGLKGSYVPEHRLVMARHIGRQLCKWEQVHHLNGNTKDNRLENLLLRDTNSHSKKYGDAYTQGYEDGYKKGYKDGSSRR